MDQKRLRRRAHQGDQRLHLLRLQFLRVRHAKVDQPDAQPVGYCALGLIPGLVRLCATQVDDATKAERPDRPVEPRRVELTRPIGLSGDDRMQVAGRPEVGFKAEASPDEQQESDQRDKGKAQDRAERHQGCLWHCEDRKKRRDAVTALNVPPPRRS